MSLIVLCIDFLHISWYHKFEDSVIRNVNISISYNKVTLDGCWDCETSQKLSQGQKAPLNCDLSQQYQNAEAQMTVKPNNVSKA